MSKLFYHKSQELDIFLIKKSYFLLLSLMPSILGKLYAGLTGSLIFGSFFCSGSNTFAESIAFFIFS